MLVLTRKVGEGIVIGDDIRLTVVEAKGGAIRIGIEAPAEKKIYREELYEKIRQENVEATHWELSDLNALSAAIAENKKDS